MNWQVYRPGEVDVEAYGPVEQEPPLPLPPWDPRGDPERAEFVAWCLAMLDREAEGPELERAMRELQADKGAVELLRDMVEQPLFDQARELMPALTREAFRLYRHGAQTPKPRKSKKRGIKGNPKVAAAVIDNARLTKLFKQHFGGAYRRPSAPGRLDILRQRHGLKDWECEVLSRYID